MDPCSIEDSRQLWEVVRPAPGSNWFKLVNLGYGIPMCLDVKDYGLSPVVQIWRCRATDAGNQAWKFF